MGSQAETEGMQLKAKEHQGLLAAIRSREEARRDSLLESSGGARMTLPPSGLQTSSFPNSERINFFPFKVPSLW